MKNQQLISLIDLAKKGNQSAQTTLMNSLWDKIYYFVYAKIKNESDAEDITIETFTKVFTKLKLYNQDFDFITWVRSIAYNTMIDHIRKRPHLKVSLDNELHNLSLESATPSPEQDLIIKQNNAALLEHIDELPQIYKEVLELRYLEDKTYKEIASALELSLANVKVRLLRAKKLLIEAMDNEN